MASDASARKCGFADSNYFCKTFRMQKQVSPREYSAASGSDVFRGTTVGIPAVEKEIETDLKTLLRPFYFFIVFTDDR